MGDYDKSAPVDHHIRPLTAPAFVKAYPAFHQLALTPLVNVPSPTLNHLAASSFHLVAAASGACRMESCPAHHRTEEIGGGPCRADPVELVGAELVGDVGVVDGGDEVDDAPRAGREG